MNYITIQNNMLTAILRWYFRLIKMTPDKMDMVQYWKTRQGIDAAMTLAPDGSTEMKMSGEKYPLKTFPRSHILFGPLSKLKHEIKNQVFNQAWAKLEAGLPRIEVIAYIKERLKGEIYTYMEPMKYDMPPMKRLNSAVREIWRAWSKVSPETWKLRNYMCMILQEDDSYCFRVQWLVQWFGWLMKLNPVKSFEIALNMLEHGEVVGDMKERARLLKRILMLMLEDPQTRKAFIALFREIKWNRVKLTKADKYHFRAKYFKVDLKYLEY